jgi:hypothetical protein
VKILFKGTGMCECLQKYIFAENNSIKIMIPLVDQQYVLEKMPGKGGWTYAVIEGVPKDKRAKFGWVQVNGSIDGFELKNYKLMPMANGNLFFPLRAEIRKKINTNAGVRVHVTLY